MKKIIITSITFYVFFLLLSLFGSIEIPLQFGNIGLYAQQFAGGTGTLGDPFLISQPNHLNNIRNYIGEENRNKHFKLINDIDLNVPPYNQAIGWRPIGSGNENSLTDYSKAFCGKLHGGRYVIKNMMIRNVGTSYQGLFGFCFSAEIDSIGLENCQIQIDGTKLSTTQHTGALIGKSIGGLVIACYSTGFVRGNQSVGGLIGTCIADIKECYSTANVSGNAEIGGLIGFMRYDSYLDIEAPIPSVTDCYATGNINSTEIEEYAQGGFGGLIGGIDNTNNVKNCYASGAVNGRNSAFGIVGSLWIHVYSSEHEPDAIGYMQGCVAANPELSGDSYCNRVIGNVISENYIYYYSISKNYALSTMYITSGFYTGLITNGTQSNSDGENKTLDELYTQSTYENGLGWDFDKIWMIPCDGNSLPLLQWQNVPGLGKGKVIATPNSINFGYVQPLQMHSQNVKVQNETAYQIEIKDAYLVNGTDFTLETDIVGMFVSPANSINAVVSQYSTTEGTKLDTLIVVANVIEIECTLTIKVPINANVDKSGYSFTIRASDNFAIDPTRKNYGIPIYIKGNETISGLKIKSVLTINKQVFQPKSVDNGKMLLTYNSPNPPNNMNDTIEILLDNIVVPNLQTNVETVLLNLKGNVLLGNTDSSAIDIIDVVPYNVNMPIHFELIDGYITIDICIEGNDRLLNIADISPGVFVLENPVNNTLKIKCNCIERGNYSLEIVDLLGTSSVIQEWKVSNPKNQSEFPFDFPIDNYGNGNYTIIMNSPTMRYYDRFNVIK